MDEMQIPERSRRPFFVSLYQFVSPAVGVDVDGGLRRMMNESVLSVVDKGVYQDLDAPLDSAVLSPVAGSTASRYRDIGPVQRPPLPALLHPPPSLPRRRRKKTEATKPSARRGKRTRAADSQVGDRPTKQRKVKEGGKTEHFRKLKKNRMLLFIINPSMVIMILMTSYAHLHNEITYLFRHDRDVPCRSLFLLAFRCFEIVQKTAKQEARLIQSTLQGIVSDLNLALLIARQWQNIAVRLVFESNTLSREVKQNLYRNLLYADEEDKRHKYDRNGARKVH